MKFYLGTSLSRAAEGNAACAILAAAGYERTYDWSDKTETRYTAPGNMGSVAEAELNGIRRADFNVFLLPGGKGTHCEIGASLVLSKTTFLCSKPGTGLFEMGNATSVFYWHDDAIRIEAETLEEQMEILLKHVRKIVSLPRQELLPKNRVWMYDIPTEAVCGYAIDGLIDGIRCGRLQHSVDIQPEQADEAIDIFERKGFMVEREPYFEKDAICLTISFPEAIESGIKDMQARMSIGESAEPTGANIRKPIGKPPSTEEMKALKATIFKMKEA